MFRFKLTKRITLTFGKSVMGIPISLAELLEVLVELHGIGIAFEVAIAGA
jgi:hypothetical protein